MSEKQAIQRKGWAKPGGSKKFHYFNHTDESLCRKWGFFFPTDQDAYDDTNDDHPENCAECRRRKVKFIR